MTESDRNRDLVPFDFGRRQVQGDAAIITHMTAEIIAPIQQNSAQRQRLSWIVHQRRSLLSISRCRRH